jgi:hypothetical protein
LRTLQRWRVDGYLVGALVEHLPGVADTAYAAGNAERDVDGLGHPPHPLHIDPAAVRAGGDIVKHQFVRALVTISRGQFQDVAHHAVITEAHAFDHLPVTHVEAGNDAPGDPV